MNEEQIKRKVNSLKDCFIANLMDRKVVLKDINDIIFWNHFMSKDYYQKFEYSSDSEKFRERIQKTINGEEFHTINHEFETLSRIVKWGIIPYEKLDSIFFQKNISIGKIQFKEKVLSIKREAFFLAFLCV